jgi:hypothetical protein
MFKTPGKRGFLAGLPAALASPSRSGRIVRCATSTRSPKASRRSSRSPAPCAIGPAICRRCRASFPTMRPDYSQCAGWRTRAHAGPLGHAGTAAVWWCAHHQHPQPGQSALARLAECRPSLCRAVQLLLRIRRHQAAQDADLVRPRRRSPAGILRRHLADMAWTPWHKSQSD